MKENLFSQCVYNDGNIFFASNRDGILAKYNIESKKISYLPTIVKEMYGIEDCIDKMLIDSSEMYILKKRGDGFIIYNLENNQYQYYNPECADNEWGNYIYMTKYKSDIFIFPRFQKVVKIFNCITKQFQKVDYNLKTEKFYSGIRIENNVWLFPCNGNLIGKFDLEEKKLFTYNANIKIDNVINCYVNDNDIYLVSANGNVWIWNIKNLKLSIFRQTKQNEQIGTVVVTKENIILLPSLGEKIVIINKYNFDEKVYENYPNDFEYQAYPGWSKYYGYCKNDKYVFFAMRSANYIMVINEVSEEISWIKPLFNKNEYFKFLLCIDNNKTENRNISLFHFLKYQDKIVNNTFANENIGKKIWTDLK